MSNRAALSDKTNTSSKDRRALLAEWKNKAKTGEGSGSGSSLLTSKRGRGLSALGGAARVTGGAARPSTAGAAADTTNKRQKTTTAWATSRSTTSARSKFASTTREMSFQIKEDESVEPRSKTIKFAEEPETDSGDAAPKTGGRSALKGSLKYTSQRPSTARARMTSGDNAGEADSVSNGAVERALKRRQEAPVQQAPQPEVEEDLGFDLDEDLDVVESSGLKSRLRAMQKKLVSLEQEKVGLSMAKAPLEARLRQNEDVWNKEKLRFQTEIDALKGGMKEADEKFRNLEHLKSTVEEENSRLNLENRKANSSVAQSAPADNTAWSKQLANDKEIVELKEKMDAYKEEIQGLKLDKISLESDNSATNMEFRSLSAKYAELQAESGDIEAAKASANEAQIQLDVLTREHIATSAQLNAVASDLAATRSTSEAELKKQTEEWVKKEKDLRFEISVLRTRGGNVDDGDLVRPDDVEDEAVLRARIEERDRTIEELKEQLIKGEAARRKMHNRIQELRGNIRVFVRTRPFLPGDGDNHESAVDVSPDGESLQIYDKTGKADNKFQFDKTFPPSAMQENVFEEVSEFVQSALDGFHVCLFSYGQTGSGKTHTMQGSGNGQMRGIIPRAVEQILEQVNVLGQQKWRYTISASFLEIYCENLKDLLVNMGDGPQGGKAPKLDIKRDADGKSYVNNLTGINICTTDKSQGMSELEAVMSAAAKTRSVAKTDMNAQSSRSHSVFMLHIHGKNEEDGTIISGALNLCDLAGSERLDRSGATGQQLKETQAINKSLSCLGDVFSSLASQSSHVPYRNSKLTYLLQDCLSGDGKALMFVNLSPTVLSSHESLCSLRFAKRVSQVELGKPTKHVTYKMGGKK
ncbi:hypothetical protein TrLO_g10352 [Triparma laevis f. longispina]|uniref:Kinesin motor domain-containing protein n=2 Tax=Triparma laevis TaxID=1534972 RepID=A0A9W7DM02_9STRA|nr:hypothetical protein TrLO_g10352 [Triparma laevis f. longispina]